MIIDTIKNLHLYNGIPAVRDVLDYLKDHDLNDLPEGTTEIDGRRFYVMIQHPVLREASVASPEAHDKYIDIQIVMKGKEIMGYAPRATQGEPIESRPENDIYFYAPGNFSQLLVDAEMFVLFFPDDAHAPCIKPQNIDVSVTKAVFKIKI